jgi:uncharacterized protein (DUF305 family)
MYMEGKQMNKNNTLIISILAILAVTGVSLFALNKNNSNNTHSNMMNSAAANISSDDYKEFAALKGDAYDRAFLANMLEHHKGAVDMSNLVLTNGEHTELKELANSIITSQSDEITSMKSWQTAWDYPASSGEKMMDHSSMGMAAGMASMSSAIKDLKGEEFDKKFLELMIEHHQSAVEMSVSGKANAKHQEIKDLTIAIVTAQTKEIDQMKQWQKDWGYVK